MDVFFMAFYLNCFFKVIVSWELSIDLKERGDQIKSLKLKDQFELLGSDFSKDFI